MSIIHLVNKITKWVLLRFNYEYNMANRIANEKEAATIGGGTSYTANLAVTKVRAIALGCTIRLTSYTDN